MKYGLQLIIMICFINCDKCTVLIRGSWVWGIWGLSAQSLWFFCKSKNTLKLKVKKKKKKRLVLFYRPRSRFAEILVLRSKITHLNILPRLCLLPACMSRKGTFLWGCGSVDLLQVEDWIFFIMFLLHVCLFFQFTWFFPHSCVQ